jgi:hypothetical protein
MSIPVFLFTFCVRLSTPNAKRQARRRKASFKNHILVFQIKKVEKLWPERRPDHFLHHRLNHPLLGAIFQPRGQEGLIQEANEAVRAANPVLREKRIAVTLCTRYSSGHLFFRSPIFRGNQHVSNRPITAWISGGSFWRSGGGNAAL